MTSVHDKIEQLARSLHQSARAIDRATPESVLELQIAFQFEQLERLREVHRDQLRGILHAECYVDTDLMQLDSYAPAKIWHYRLGARDNLKNKLLRLDEERRRLLLWYEREMRDLGSRLLQLVSRRAILQS